MANSETALILRMEASLAKFEKQMAKGRQVARDYSKDTEASLVRANQRISAQADRAAKAVGRVTVSAGAQRFVIQNTANQLGDMAVQIAGGTSASRAMAQQLPQLAGGFGVLGGTLGTVAPILGLIAAIGIPVATALIAMHSSQGQAAASAKDLAEKVTALEKAQNAYSQAVDLAKTPIEELRAKYGDLADEVQHVLDLQQRLRGEEARATLTSIGTGAAKDFGAQAAPDIAAAERRLADLRKQEADLQSRLASAPDYLGAIGQLGNVKAQIADMRSYDQAIAQVAATYGLARDQVVALAQAASTLAAASTPADQVAAAQNLADLLIEIYGSVQIANEKTGGLVSSLLDAVKTGADVAATAADMKDNLGGAADNADRMAKAISDAALEYGKLQNTYGSGMDAAAAGVMADRKPNGPIQTYYPGGEPPKPRGGSNLNSDQVAQLSKARQLFAETRTEAEKYAATLSDLEGLHQSGLISDDTYSRALAKVRDEFDHLQTAGDQTAQALRTAFEGIFDDPQKALKTLAMQLAKMALYQQLGASFPSIFGASGIIPLSGARAAGGPVGAGSAYLVGEKGPEVFVPGASGTIIPNGGAAPAKGGGSSVIVNNYSGQPTTQTKTTGVDGQEFIVVTVGDAISRGKFDAQNGGRYGSRPQRVRR